MVAPSVVGRSDGLIQYGERTFRCLRGSDVLRDGMYLALFEGQEAIGEEVAEVFFADETGEFSLSLFVPGVPLALIEWLIDRAKESLPPTGD